MSSTPLYGVLGGMGPLATVDFLHKLVLATPASRDQEHIPTLIWNVPQIPDRQHYLAGHGTSPLPAMLEGISRLNAAGATRIVIPCNTAHIWYDELAAASAAPIIHIVDATLDSLNLASGAVVGLIATAATLQARLYQHKLATRGIEYIVPEESLVTRLFTPGCYAVKRNQLQQGGQVLAELGQALLDQGAERLVLACTEVPVALAAIQSPLLQVSVDPAEALVQAVIRDWAGHRPHQSRHSYGQRD